MIQNSKLNLTSSPYFSLSKQVSAQRLNLEATYKTIVIEQCSISVQPHYKLGMNSLASREIRARIENIVTIQNPLRFLLKLVVHDIAILFCRLRWLNHRRRESDQGQSIGVDQIAEFCFKVWKWEPSSQESVLNWEWNGFLH